MKVIEQGNKLILHGVDTKSLYSSIAVCLLFLIPIGIAGVSKYLFPPESAMSGYSMLLGILFFWGGLFGVVAVIQENHYRKTEVQNNNLSTKGRLKSWEVTGGIEIKLIRGPKGIGWIVLILSPVSNLYMTFLYKKDALHISDLIKTYYGEFGKVLHDYV